MYVLLPKDFLILSISRLTEPTVASRRLRNTVSADDMRWYANERW